MKRALLSTLAGLGLMVWSGYLLAVEEASPDEKAAKAALEAAASHMQRMTMRRRDREDGKIELVGQPLLSFGDSARVHNNGTLWAWGKQGRPVAFLELFQQPQQNGRWIHAVTLAGTANVTLDIPLTGRWQPKTTTFEPAALDGSATPAAKEPARLRQLKDAARRFTAHEFWDPNRSRYELRLLVQPVHRYADPTAGVQDGAVFVFAHGTNPECLLLIDAAGESLESARWSYALVRSGDAELHVELDGREVWKCDRAAHVGDVRSSPYWVFLSPREAVPSDDLSVD
ncbi:MAG TPA: hypothetical protein VG125_00335 [Pirellulales bacterium]|nr:hypothetical protein [Pirellulales bacterium]